MKGFESSCAISTSGSITRCSEREAAVFVISFRILKNVQTIAPGVIRRWIIYKWNRAAAGHLRLTHFQSWIQQRMNPVLVTTFILEIFLCNNASIRTSSSSKSIASVVAKGTNYQTHTHTHTHTHTQTHSYMSTPHFIPLRAYNFCIWPRDCCSCLTHLTAYSTSLACTRNCCQGLWICGARTLNILARWVG